MIMKLLLQRSIEKLGKAGDLVEVNKAYARNYLLPCGLALEPTPGNLKRIEELRAVARQQELAQLKELQAQAEVLNGVEVTIPARANEQGHLFGSVGPADVSAALAEMGFSNVPPEAILIDPHIKQLDKYTVEIRLSEETLAQIELWVVPEKTPEDEDQSDEQLGSPPDVQTQDDAVSDQAG
jgi:large subunit ribosomal protein L9